MNDEGFFRKFHGLYSCIPGSLRIICLPLDLSQIICLSPGPLESPWIICLLSDLPRYPRISLDPPIPLDFHESFRIYPDLPGSSGLFVHPRISRIIRLPSDPPRIPPRSPRIIWLFPDPPRIPPDPRSSIPDLRKKISKSMNGYNLYNWKKFSQYNKFHVSKCKTNYQWIVSKNSGIIIFFLYTKTLNAHRFYNECVIVHRNAPMTNENFMHQKVNEKNKRMRNYNESVYS